MQAALENLEKEKGYSGINAASGIVHDDATLKKIDALKEDIAKLSSEVNGAYRKEQEEKANIRYQKLNIDEMKEELSELKRRRDSRANGINAFDSAIPDDGLERRISSLESDISKALNEVNGIKNAQSVLTDNVSNDAKYSFGSGNEASKSDDVLRIENAMEKIIQEKGKDAALMDDNYKMLQDELNSIKGESVTLDASAKSR